MMVNNDDDVDDDEIIPLVPKFGDVSRSSFIISNDQTLSFRCMPEGSEFGVWQIFSSENELVNIVEQCHIAHSFEYRVQ